MKTSIIVTTDKIALHQWKDAPEDVGFLRNEHRHKFHIRLGIPVLHMDRELEFFTIQNDLNEFLRLKVNVGSCEMLATEIKKWADNKYQRKSWCEVWEDKENGARVE